MSDERNIMMTFTVSVHADGRVFAVYVEQKDDSEVLHVRQIHNTAEVLGHIEALRTRQEPPTE